MTDPLYGPCPPWCTTDHSRPGVSRHHKGPRTAITGFRRHPHDEVSTRLMDFGQAAGPQVLVSTWCSGAGDEGLGHRYLGADEARYLALIVEMLAGATAAQHRELAASLRTSAESLAHEEAADGQQ